MKRIVLALIIISISAPSWAKVPIRFPYKLFPGMSPDTVVAALLEKEFSFDQSPLEGEDVRHYVFECTSMLAQDIPVVELEATFLLDQLVSVEILMPTQAEADSQAARIALVRGFVEKTYFIDTSWAPESDKLTGNFDRITMTYRAGRMAVTISSSFDPNAGYTVHINYEDKRLLEVLTQRLMRKY